MDNYKKEGVFSMSTTVQKWGNSLGVRIPKRVAEKMDVVNGSQIELVEKDGGLFIRPVKQVPTLEELIAQCTPENRHEEVDWGKPVGKEIW